MLISQGFFFHQARHRAACSEQPKPDDKAAPPPKESEPAPEGEERGDIFKSDGPGAGGGYSEAAGEDRVNLSDEARKEAGERRDEEPIYEIEGPGAGGGYLRRPEDEDGDEVVTKPEESPKKNEKE